MVNGGLHCDLFGFQFVICGVYLQFVNEVLFGGEGVCRQLIGDG